MAAPTITWRKYTSSLQTPGVGQTDPISEITLGTVTAGQWSTAVCVGINVDGNTAKNVRFWMNDSSAVVYGTPVSMGKSGKEWGIRATATNTLVGTNALFGTKGGAWNQAATSLAADWKAGLNSLGAGVSLGRGTSLAVTSGNHSRYVFLSIKPHASAYDGEHTGFTFQVGYDFT